MLLENILRLLLREFSTRDRVAVGDFTRSIGVEEKAVIEAVEVYGLKIEEGYILVEDWRNFIFNLLEKGFNLEDILRYLYWREFENICEAVLMMAGFYTFRNLRFKARGRRYEIDVVGVKGDKVLLIDCKKWKRMSSSMLKNAVEKQLERTRALSETLESVGLHLEYSRILLIPVIVTMLAGDMAFYDSVPIVPISKLKNFLYNFENILDKLNVEEVYITRLFERRGSSLEEEG